MSITASDREILRRLADEFAAIAHSDISAQRVESYRQLNSLKQIRPPVLVFEIPWGEFSDDEALVSQCEGKEARDYEWHMRSEIYKWKHFQGDYALHPYWRCDMAVKNSGIGLDISEQTIESLTGTAIRSHYFNDLLPDEESLEKIKIPVISHDIEETERRLAFARSIFDGLLDVKKSGRLVSCSSWDVIPRLHGVEDSIIDLCARPEYSHAVIEKFTRVREHELNEYERLNVLDTDPYYVHCTPAATYDLPVLDPDKDDIKAKHVWCRGMAQIFSVVSPEMHDEFDLQYTKRLFDRCGLNYYGCCEPLDTKIHLLRQFKNLRRISITPWADVVNASEQIQGDYVLSYKSNPAYVAGKNFDPAPVEAETKRVIETCLKNGTPFEFILKDISTVSRNPKNIILWLETVNGVIDRYF